MFGFFPALKQKDVPRGQTRDTQRQIQLRAKSDAEGGIGLQLPRNSNAVMLQSTLDAIELGFPMRLVQYQRKIKQNILGEVHNQHGTPSLPLLPEGIHAWLALHVGDGADKVQELGLSPVRKENGTVGTKGIRIHAEHVKLGLTTSVTVSRREGFGE